MAQPIKLGFLKEKMRPIQRQMEETGIDLWVTFTREYADEPVSSDLRLNSLEGRSVGILDRGGNRTAIVGNGDVDIVKQRAFYDEVIGWGDKGPASKMYEIIHRRQPRKIAVNTSVDYTIADELASGMKEYLLRALKEYGNRLVSSEDLIITLRSRLIPAELELLKEAIRKTDGIFDATQDFIKVGKSDKEIHEFMRSLVAAQNMTVSWEEAPGVSVGRDTASHMSYHNTKLRDGDFLRLDFGVVYEGYCSDLQRDYFVGKGNVPGELRKMFDTASAANDACIRALRSGIEGCVADKPARDTVLAAGFPDYAHGTGHPIARLVHDIGPRLAPATMERYGNAGIKKLSSGLVFSVEPSIVTPLGNCNLEQDVLVTDTGATRLSKRQDDLIFIA
jgi:Xaa-Pro aminopeptidase